MEKDVFRVELLREDVLRGGVTMRLCGIEGFSSLAVKH